MTDQLGTIFSRSQLEQAVIDTLQQFPEPGGTAPRIVYYLAQMERTQGLTPRTLKPPPGPRSYRGGVDANTMEPEWFPMIHVLAQPTGKAEPFTQYEYGQAYDLQVISTVGDNDEDQARLIADGYAGAVARALADRGSLGIGASGTQITRLGDVQLLDPVNARQVCRTTVRLTTLIAPVMTVGAPSSWADDPYQDPGQLPTVTEVNVTVAAQPID